MFKFVVYLKTTGQIDFCGTCTVMADIAAQCVSADHHFIILPEETEVLPDGDFYMVDVDFGTLSVIPRPFFANLENGETYDIKVGADFSAEVPQGTQVRLENTEVTVNDGVVEFSPPIAGGYKITMRENFPYQETTITVRAT